MSRRGLAVALALAAALAFPACDSITNPGPVLDDDLNDPRAQDALVNGMALSLQRAAGRVAYFGAVAARELVPVGGLSPEFFGHSVRMRQGLLDGRRGEADNEWQLAQQARWVAEDGVRRMQATLDEAFSTTPVAARALLHAGYANRLLGENMCEAVIDGGGADHRRVFLERAEAAFGEAAEIAGRTGQPEVERAALAGRAAVRAWLGDWEGAADDAAGVPEAFAFHARFSALEVEQYNPFYWGNANQPFRNHSVWSTFYEAYYEATADPRVAWITVPEHPLAENPPVPWLVQVKHAERDASIRLSSGREMRLIEAEARLREGDWSAAVEIIDGLRTGGGMSGSGAETEPDAWSALKRERAVELWLEGRRLGDLHRWIEEGTPGEMEEMDGRSTCFPIGQSERDTNPNLGQRPG